MSSTDGKHASSGAARPAVAEPTFAERARTFSVSGSGWQSLNAFAETAGLPIRVCNALWIGRPRESHLPHRSKSQTDDDVRLNADWQLQRLVKEIGHWPLAWVLVCRR